MNEKHVLPVQSCLIQFIICLILFFQSGAVMPVFFGGSVQYFVYPKSSMSFS